MCINFSAVLNIKIVNIQRNYKFSALYQEKDNYYTHIHMNNDSRPFVNYLNNSNFDIYKAESVNLLIQI